MKRVSAAGVTLITAALTAATVVGFIRVQGYWPIAEYGGAHVPDGDLSGDIGSTAHPYQTEYLR